MREVARAFENLLLSTPDVYLAAGMGADGGVSDHAVGRALLRHAHQRRRIETQHQYLVEARVVADDIARGIHGPGQHRRAAERDVLELERTRLLALDCNQEISLLGPLARGIGERRSSRELEAQERHEGQESAPGGALDRKASTLMVAPRPAHHLDSFGRSTPERRTFGQSGYYQITSRPRTTAAR